MIYPQYTKRIATLGIKVSLCFLILANIVQAEVNIYSAREETLIKPILDVFSEQTGIKTNLVTAKADALIERLQREGQDSLADVLITTDVARLHRAKQAGLLQSVQSEKLMQIIPAAYRDSDNQWFGLSLRARIIAVVKESVPTGEQPMRYESLADEQWRERICIRSSNNVYNQSLVASMIHVNGEDATYNWAQALVSNFARPPVGGDRDQILAAAGGLCDIAVVNTYYLAYMLANPDKVQSGAANKMHVVWPNQEDRGTHVNISGAGVTRIAKNKDDAIRLLEFLVDKEAQHWYSDVNYEYPIRSDVEVAAVLDAWGTFKADTIKLDKLGELNSEAVKLMDRAGWQ
ncbi:MAG: Fe(3+) ABC transporter substrate-binding protein [Gammaproteobacteria bacterium]|nr:Fe(3+) ABC transporter substrate-binding protein [Gammaproteobacteria bacterium]